jgi:N6-adenosine-specific RNA methylase IME4
MALPSIVIPKRGAPVKITQLLNLERQIADAVVEVKDIDALDHWRAQARALEGYLRDKEMQGPMLAAQRRCEARIGQLLGPTTEGGRTDLTVTHAEQLTRRADRSDFRILAHALDGGMLVGNEWRECKLEYEEWRKSRRALISTVRQRLGLVEDLAALPSGIFRCIVADPPWELKTGPDAWGTKETGNEPLDYPTLSVDRIKAMPVALHAAEHAHLYLWTVNRYVEAAYEIARAWDFTPSTLLVWAKTPHGVGLGHDFRLTTEFILYARRGNLKASQICPTSWFNWPRGVHSKKAEEFYQLVESMTPAPHAERDRLELFAREQRAGWTVWGNEVEADHAAE